MENKKTSFIIDLYEWIETFIIALLVVILVFTFGVKYVTVSGTSMNKTLENGDHLFISNLTEKEVGDIVVVDVTENLKESGRFASVNGAPFIKRIIAKEGDKVYIDPYSWTVYVNNKPLDEPYAYRDGAIMHTGTIEYPYTVPEGCVFVMGDNRNGSTDSRDIGAVDERYVLGKVIFKLG